MENAYLHMALRTPRGKSRPDGGLAGFMPEQLVAGLAKEMDRRRPGVVSAVDSLHLGSVGQVGDQGGHIALISKIAAGLPEQSAAITINNFCVSSLSAAGLATMAVRTGQSRWAMSGGVEMMSRVPFMADRAAYYTNHTFPAEQQYVPVTLAADLLATREGITRGELDDCALMSQNRAEAAENRPGLLASRVPLGGLTREEPIRPTTTLSLGAMEPAFASQAVDYAGPLNGEVVKSLHTIAHAPPTTDGASLALFGPRDGAVARIVSHAEFGGNSRESLTAGFKAMELALERAGMSLIDMDRIEFMEAFGVCIAKFVRDYAPDMDKVNVGGGHLAKGHPMGATGGILLSTLLDAVVDADGHFGLVVATAAQGVGSAMIIERL